MAEIDNEVPVWEPHYRVCKKMAAPRVEKDPDPPKESAYLPLTLRASAARVVRRERLPLDTLPADLRDWMKETYGVGAGGTAAGCGHSFTPVAAVGSPFLEKDRTCSEINYLRVGHFDDFPTALNEPLDRLSHLITEARSVLSFLALAEAGVPHQPSDGPAISHSFHKRYPMFLRLQASAVGVPLLPPIDIESVWFSHMLQSSVYPAFAKQHGIALDFAHTSVSLLTRQARAIAEERCRALWAREYGATEPYDYKPKAGANPLNADARTMVNDRDWYVQFKKATAGISDVTSETWLRKALLGYQRFLYLMAKYPRTLEFIRFAPSPPIDLMWHTHLLQPAVYAVECPMLIVTLTHHKLLPEVQRTPKTYKSRTDAEEKLWRSEFGESITTYLGSKARIEFSCDRCEKPITKSRYHCQICQDYDLCDGCSALPPTSGSKHTSEHRLIMFTIPKE